MLCYPDYSILFLKFLDTSEKQLGDYACQISNTSINLIDVKEVFAQEC